MDLSPLVPLLAPPLAPLHSEGLGWDELVPAGLAVLIGIGVYTLIAGGKDGAATRGAKRARRRQNR